MYIYNMMLKPYFGRVGSKRFLKPEIYALFPPTSTYDTYVEPFIGGGAVFLGMETDVKTVISDLDRGLISAWELIKEGIEGNFFEFCSNNIDQLQSWKDMTPKTRLERLVKYMVTYSNTFGNKGCGRVYKTTNPYNKLKHLDKYKEKLKNTTIIHGDYKEVMKEFDSPTTLFYLDPPYCGTKSLYKHELLTTMNSSRF